jgi:predicted nuclease with TOPRIM domain
MLELWRRVTQVEEGQSNSNAANTQLLEEKEGLNAEKGELSARLEKLTAENQDHLEAIETIEKEVTRLSEEKGALTLVMREVFDSDGMLAAYVGVVI